MARWPHTSAWSADHLGEASSALVTDAFGSGGAAPSSTEAAPPMQAINTAVARSEWITSIRTHPESIGAPVSIALRWASGAHRVPLARRSSTSKTPRCRRTYAKISYSL